MTSEVPGVKTVLGTVTFGAHSQPHGGSCDNTPPRSRFWNHRTSPRPGVPALGTPGKVTDRRGDVGSLLASGPCPDRPGDRTPDAPDSGTSTPEEGQPAGSDKIHLWALH